jgi:N-acetylneuraminate synthase
MANKESDVLVIAEAGVNHNGDVRLAKDLVKVAAEAGADVVKFQTFRADRLTNRVAAKARYQDENAPNFRTQFEMLRSLELSERDHHLIFELCSEHEIEFLSTGFDIEDVDFLVRMGIKRIKVPSGEITNFPLLQHIAGLDLPTVLSTGMSTIEEIAASLDVLMSKTLVREDITILQCTTAYPCPIEHVNLLAIPELHRRFDTPVGFSDHTDGLECAVGAVALGATVIEKHLTLDKRLPGPDHKASLEPDQFAEMVVAIRNVSKALGSPQKTPTRVELENMAVARRSLVAARAIRKGELITADMLGTKRPGTGLSPMMWSRVVGTRALRDFQQDELLEI